MLARGPLPELTRTLMAEYGAQRVLDVRRPKAEDPGAAPRALLGLGAMLLLAGD